MWWSGPKRQTMNLPFASQYLPQFIAIATAAGAKIMEIYHGDFATALKSDASPVTAADTAAEAIIIAGLKRDFPNIPIIAEEQQAAGQKIAIADTFFLVDPLDGTKEFISRNGEFTVNIALIQNSAPVCGVVLAPALGEVYVGEMDLGAFAAKTPPLQFSAIATRGRPAAGPTILASRSHLDAQTEAFIAAQKPASIANAGSSLKFCRVAEGKADLYPRFGRTMEWDTAAGHAVLTAAGGKVVTPDGGPFVYGKSGFANGPFIASGRT